MTDMQNRFVKLNPFSGKHHANSPTRLIRLVNNDSSQVVVKVSWEDMYWVTADLNLRHSKADGTLRTNIINQHPVATEEEVLEIIYKIREELNESLKVHFKLKGED